MSRQRNGWVLPVSLLLALLLGVVPLPDWLQPLRPYWLALVLAYWLLEVPERVGLGVAFGLGLLADLAFGGLLGEQALLAYFLRGHLCGIQFHPEKSQAVGVAFIDNVMKHYGL